VAAPFSPLKNSKHTIGPMDG